MMSKLGKPSEDLARRIRGELGFEDRFVGYRLRAGKGFLPVPVYSFAEAVGLLSAPDPFLELQLLEQWVREKIGDPELADLIAQQMATSVSLSLKLTRVRDLMALRLIQCRAL